MIDFLDESERSDSGGIAMLLLKVLFVFTNASIQMSSNNLTPNGKVQEKD